MCVRRFVDRRSIAYPGVKSFGMRIPYYHYMTLSLPSVAGASGGPSTWVAIVVAVIAMLGTIVANTVAAISARASKRSELQAQRISELESRISERKYGIYKPILEMLGDVLNSGPSKIGFGTEEIQKRLHEFFVWVSIYGSDEAVMAHHRFSQAAYNKVPPEIATRLYAELILAARRDIGRSDTKIGPADIVGIKVSDLYTNAEYYRTMTQPFDELCQKYNWTPPWTLPGNEDSPSLPPSS